MSKAWLITGSSRELGRAVAEAVLASEGERPAGDAIRTAVDSFGRLDVS